MPQVLTVAMTSQTTTGGAGIDEICGGGGTFETTNVFHWLARNSASPCRTMEVCLYVLMMEPNVASN